MKHEHVQEAARDAKKMEESTILGGDPLLETCTCTRIETEFSQMCDYCQALEKKHPGYFAGLEPSWTGTNQGDGHDSDCATHNEPAYQNGACDCAPVTAKDMRDMASRLYTMSGCRGISTRTLAELVGLISRAAETINNLEIALRITKEEHDCCAEDLSVYRYVEDKCGWSICQYSKQHGWIPAAWHDAVMAMRKSRQSPEPEWQTDVQAAFGGIVQTPQG